MTDIEDLKNEVVGTEPGKSALDDIFTDRDYPNREKETFEEQPVKKETVNPEEKSEKSKKTEEVKKVEKKEISKIDDDEGDDEPVTELEKYKKELEKSKKALADSQKWGHTNSKKLKAAIKSAQSLAEQGILTNEETKTLIQSLESEDFEVDAEMMDSNVHPITKYVNAANERFKDLKEIYEDDEMFDQKSEAFNHFLRDGDAEEIEEVLEHLESIKDSPLKIAKYMYKVGEKHFNEIYKDYMEAGGLKKFLSTKNNEIEKLNRKVDKLQKKLLQYEDYDKSNFRIDELSDSSSIQEGNYGSVFDQAAKERDKPRNNRR